MKYGIIGMGDLGKQLFSFLLEIGYNPDEFVFFDDILFGQKKTQSFPFDGWKDPSFSNLNIFLGIGYKHMQLKLHLIESLLKRNIVLPNIIHYTAYVHPSAKIGHGVYLYPGVVIDQNVQISNGVLLNNRVTVSHDSMIGAASFLSPAVTVCGNVKIGTETFIGAASVISNTVIIGNNCRISLGSKVFKNLDDGSDYKFDQVVTKKINIL